MDWLTEVPLFSVIVMVARQWLPFACLIFISPRCNRSTANRWRPRACRNGANAFQHASIPSPAPPGPAMAVVIMIEMIFLLSVFAEIAITTNGGPGNEQALTSPT